MKVSSIDTLLKILSSVDEIPKSMLEISRKANTSWEATKNKLNELKELDLVIEIEKKDNKKNKFYIINPIPKIKKNYETYFNIPINYEDKQKIESWFFHIQNKWFEITNTKPKITQVYKTLAFLNKKLRLNLPFGWYNFGQIPLLIYDEQKIYSNTFNLLDNENKVLDEVIQRYLKENKIYKINRLHYEDFDKTTYILKDNLMKEFKSNKKEIFNLENIKLLYSYLSNEKIEDYFTDYLFNFYLLLVEINFKKIEINEDYRFELFNLFCEIWKFITIDEFKISLKEKIPEAILENCLKNKIKSKKLELDEKFSEICFNLNIDEKVFNQNKENISRLTQEEIENLENDKEINDIWNKLKN